MEEVKGNRLTLLAPDGRRIEAHAEDVLVVPPSAELLEVEPLDLIPQEDQPRSLEGVSRSPGEMLEDAGQDVAKAAGSGRGKKPQLEPGLHIVYAKDSQLKICSVGRVWALTKAEASVRVHKFRGQWGASLRVRWMPLFMAQMVQTLRRPEASRVWKASRPSRF